MTQAGNATPLTSDEIIALQQLSTPTVANAIETFNIQSRDSGFMNSTVRAVVPGSSPMVGYACTAKMRATTKPTPDTELLFRQIWEHILTQPGPRVIVIEDLDAAPIGAFWGEVQANIHRALGCVGVVTNGGVRDLDEVRALGFQFFAGSVMVSHAYAHLVEVGTPVTVGGLTVSPGDLLHGDQHGVCAIPPATARDLPRVARELEAQERDIIAHCQSAEFSIDRLHELFHAHR